MLKDIYTPIDEPSERAIELAHELAESDALLAGLGRHCTHHSVPEGFNIIADMKRSHFLLTSQDMWDDSIDTGQDEFFKTVSDSAVNGYARYEHAEQMRRKKPMKRKITPHYDYLESRCAVVLEKHKVIEFQHAHNAQDFSEEEVRLVVNNVYIQSVGSYFRTIIESGFMGGLDTWPIAQSFYNCLKTGGMPTGWVGTGVEDGGDPEACMQLLHYGPSEKG